MKTFSLATLAVLFLAGASHAADLYAWRYYRPTNTGIQGDSCEAIHLDPDSNPWISGYQESFEEGGIAKCIVSQNRWMNISNVDYPVIGHPDFTGISRVSDIDSDSAGGLWMSTGRGGLYYDPAVGPSSLRRFGADNSSIHGGWNKGVEVAPDGTVWFSSYSTAWGGGGISKYNPSTNQWQSFESYGGGQLAIQPKSNGYYVWTMLGIEVARFDSATSTWTVFPQVDGNPAFLPGKNLTDSAANIWMYRWTNAAMNEMKIDLRRPNGTWVGVAPAPFDVQFNNASCLRALGAGIAYAVDGGGQAYRYDGAGWTSLGYWQQTVSTYDIDVDPTGNVWVCGSDGAARRDAGTGTWQRYRVTNTSQYDFFNNDLTLDANGGLYACANAGPGYGGMVKYDGQRWIGINNHHYGLGIEWPFPTDNTSKVYLRPSNGQLVLNPMFNGLHTFDGINWTDLAVGTDSVSDTVEDSFGRLWVTFYGNLKVQSGNGWTVVANDILGDKLRRDPSRPGTIVAMGWTSIIRTDGVTTQTWHIEDFPMLDPQSDQFKGIAVADNGIVWIGAYTVNLPNNSVVIKLNMNTGAYTVWRQSQGWPFPGQYAMPLAVTPDGKVWMQYDSDYLVALRGLCWFDGANVGTYPAPPGGEPQWGGLPHAGIVDCEVRPIGSGYELWLSCASRGIAVLQVTNTNSTPTLTSIAPASVNVNQGNFVLTVTGTNFVGGSSTIRWNGVAQATTYIGPTQLSCVIANGTNQTIGLVPITVANGSQTSNVVNLQCRGAVAPIAFATVTGTLVQGGLAELLQSDDARLGVRPSFVGARIDPNIVVEATFPAPVTSAAELRFEAELLATVGPNDVKIQAFDYASNVWVDLLSSMTNTIDTLYSHGITSNTNRYISGGQMKMRVWIRAKGANGSRSWQAQIDRMAIQVNP